MAPQGYKPYLFACLLLQSIEKRFLYLYYQRKLYCAISAQFQYCRINSRFVIKYVIEIRTIRRPEALVIRIAVSALIVDELDREHPDIPRSEASTRGIRSCFREGGSCEDIIQIFTIGRPETRVHPTRRNVAIAAFIVHKRYIVDSQGLYLRTFLHFPASPLKVFWTKVCVQVTLPSEPT